MNVTGGPWARAALFAAAGCAGAGLLLAGTSLFIHRGLDVSSTRAPAGLALAWTPEHPPDRSALNAVCTDGAGDAYAVGARGAVLHRTAAGAWSKEGSPTLEDLHGVAFGSTPPRVYAVGNGGVVIARAAESGTWSLETTPTHENLYAVAVCPAGVCAVGARGTFVCRDQAGSWIASDTGTRADLHAIAGWVSAPATPTVPASIATFVVGDGGTILVQRAPFGRGQATPTRWTREAAPTSENLTAAAFLGYDVVVVGARGTMLRRDVSNDEGWATLRAPASEALRDVRLVSAAEPRIAVVGAGGVYEQRYPQTDVWRTTLRAPGLRALDAYDPRVLVVGDDGAVHVALIPAPPDD